jgi:hypothetical protein
MKTKLMICLLVAAALWLSGCTVISFEESGRTKRLYTFCTPSQGVIRVVHVPCPESRPRESHLLQ